jgi:hypothetical protein
MPCLSFPKEPYQLAAMEMRLQNANLYQVHQTIEQLTDLSAKTGTIAQAALSGNLFESAMKRTEELGNQEIVLNHQICHFREEMNDLMIEKDRLTPEQIAYRLDELQKKIFSCSRPSTPCLQEELRSLENQWSHLYFLYAFPVAEELNPDSFFSNYFHRISHRIEQMRSNDPGQAAKLQTLLKDLQRECAAAEMLFLGKGDRGYRLLPQDTQRAIQQRLFAYDPELSLKMKEGAVKEKFEILAGAIMADLADRMID